MKPPAGLEKDGRTWWWKNRWIQDGADFFWFIIDVFIDNYADTTVFFGENFLGKTLSAPPLRVVGLCSWTCDQIQPPLLIKPALLRNVSLFVDMFFFPFEPAFKGVFHCKKHVFKIKPIRITYAIIHIERRIPRRTVNSWEDQEVYNKEYQSSTVRKNFKRTTCLKY